MKNRPTPLSFNHSRDELKKIKVVINKERIKDPFEKTKTTSVVFNPVYIKGIVREIDASRLTWELYGLKEKGAIELICDKKHKSLLKKASNLYYNGEEYLVYKTASGKRSAITSKGNYLIVILERT